MSAGERSQTACLFFQKMCKSDFVLQVHSAQCWHAHGPMWMLISCERILQCLPEGKGNQLKVSIDRSALPTIWHLRCDGACLGLYVILGREFNRGQVLLWETQHCWGSKQLLCKHHRHNVHSLAACLKVRKSVSLVHSSKFTLPQWLPPAPVSLISLWITVNKHQALNPATHTPICCALTPTEFEQKHQIIGWHAYNGSRFLFHLN